MSKRDSIYDEEIVVKPSIELIPDEYEHQSNDKIIVKVFKTDEDYNRKNADDFRNTLKEAGFMIEDTSIYDLETTDLSKAIDEIKTECEAADALIMFFTNNYDKRCTELPSSGENRIFEIQKIWTQFTASNCPALKNKPKIFIFALTKKVETTAMDGLRHFTATYETTYDTPAEADILIVFHNDTLIHDESFVGSLCNNIKQYGKSEDLITLASCTDTPTRPVIVSTLTRKFYTTVSKDRGHHLLINENTDMVSLALENLSQRLKQLEESKEEKKEKKFSIKRILSMKKDRVVVDSNMKKSKDEKVKIENEKKLKNELKKSEKSNVKPSLLGPGPSGNITKPTSRRNSVIVEERRRTVSTSDDNPLKRTKEKTRWRY